jgi:hypothetical protein
VFPGSFVLRVVTPLYLAHLDYLTVSHSFCDVQDFNRSHCRLDHLPGQALPSVVVPLELANIS